MFKTFDYHRPKDLNEACGLMMELPDAQVLAGGTDLLVDIESGVRQASHVISLKSINELKTIEDINGMISIGAGCTVRYIESSTLIQRYFPEITEMISSFASPQIRTLATVGGNICSAVACGDFPVILTALNAEVELISQKGKRVIPLKDFFIGNRKTNRSVDEILSRILIRKKAPTAAAVYLKFKRRASNSLAVAGVAVFLDIRDSICKTARIVLGAVAPKPLLAEKAGKSLEGKRITEKTTNKAAEIARKEAVPITDVRGTREYRQELIYVLTGRAIRAVLARCKRY